jgi:pimeloyl-ACP methyl ester carboxylesterase
MTKYNKYNNILSMIEKHIIVDGLNINYYHSEKFDREKAVVFLHGWQSEARHLQKIFEEADNYIAIDLPGFGGSDLSKEIWGVGEYAVFLRKFFEKMGIVMPVLIGHSFGGSVIIKYIASGEEAKKLILIASVGIRDKSVKIIIYKIMAKFFKMIFSLPLFNLLREKARNHFYTLIDAEDYLNAGVLVKNYKKIISEDLQEEMKKIEIETILIWGKDDQATPLKNGRLLKKLIKNSKLFVVEKAGHFVFLDNEKEFQRIFKSILC